jgi:hypothetical protein
MKQDKSTVLGLLGNNTATSLVQDHIASINFLNAPQERSLLYDLT